MGPCRAGRNSRKARNVDTMWIYAIDYLPREFLELHLMTKTLYQHQILKPMIFKSGEGKGTK